LHHDVVSGSEHFFSDPYYFMPMIAECHNDNPGDILISAIASSLTRKGTDFFSVEARAGIGQAGADVFHSDARVILDNLGKSPSTGQQVNDVLYCNAGAFNNGLAREDLMVYFDVVLPGHGRDLFTDEILLFRMGG